MPLHFNGPSLICELEEDVRRLKYLFVTLRSAEAMNACTAQSHTQKPAQNNRNNAPVLESKYLKIGFQSSMNCQDLKLDANNC